MEKPVVFKNQQGGQLVGMLHLPKTMGQARFPAVVICHGFNRNKAQRKFVELGRELAKNDIVALRFDFYGSGDSGGDFEKMTISQEINDLDSAITFLKKQRFVNEDSIGLLGHSLGGFIVAAEALQSLTKMGIKTLVFLAPALDQAALIKNWHTPSQIKKWKKLGYNDTDDFRIGVQYLKEAENGFLNNISLSVPILIIHGTKDDAVRLKYSKQFFKGLEKPKKLKLIKGGDHDLERHQVKQEMIEETVSWFKKYLR